MVLRLDTKGGEIVENKDKIRLYYKSQSALGMALRDYIDMYFQNKIQDEELEEKIMEVVEANKEKFYNDDLEIASKPKLILGKTRLEVLNKIITKKGGVTK